MDDLLLEKGGNGGLADFLVFVAEEQHEIPRGRLKPEHMEA